jgi:hypothetical protein
MRPEITMRPTLDGACPASKTRAIRSTGNAGKVGKTADRCDGGDICGICGVVATCALDAWDALHALGDGADVGNPDETRDMRDPFDEVGNVNGGLACDARMAHLADGSRRGRKAVFEPSFMLFSNVLIE